MQDLLFLLAAAGKMKICSRFFHLGFFPHQQKQASATAAYFHASGNITMFQQRIRESC